LAEAESAQEFHKKLPLVLEVVNKYVHILRSGIAPFRELAIRKHLSQNLDEYKHNVLQAIAADQLATEGVAPNPGESVSYIITNSRSKLTSKRILALELCENNRIYDAEVYVDLLLSAVETILVPFGLNKTNLRAFDQKTRFMH